MIFLLLNEFGSGQFDYANLMPYILKTFEFSNPAIRNWVLEIIKSLFKWIRDDIKQYLIGLKEIQLVNIR